MVVTVVLCSVTALRTDMAHAVVGKDYNFQPLLSRTEVTNPWSL